MKSITARFTALIILAVLLSVAVVGASSMFALRDKADSDAVSIINLTCANEAQRINATLDDIGQAVDTVASFAEGKLGSPARFFADEPYRADYTADVEDLFLNIAAETDGAVSFYFRYNAQDVASTQGFLYGRSESGGAFQQIPLTDLSLYDEDDDEHVGWYYIPLRNGEPTWLAPYDNKNLGIYMISYVVPVYADGLFIGVIGMDVDFSIVVSQLQGIHPYESGYAALIGDDGTVYYHPALDYGTLLNGQDASLPNFPALARHAGDGDGLVSFESDGRQKLMTRQGLQNGMNLVLIADESDINADRDRLLVNLLIGVLAIIAIFAAAGVATGKALMRPLRELTSAAREVSEGNLDVTLPQSGSSEVSTLIGAYRVTVDRMREQMQIIDEMAHRDSLTGLLNKSSYDERVAELDARIAEGRPENAAQAEGGSGTGEAAESAQADADAASSATTPSFALAMADANELKFVNDTYGHERGDDYLRNAVARLTAAFPDCELYRIGGDEFVALAEGTQARALIDSGIAAIEGANDELAHDAQDLEPWERVSLACGRATYDPSRDGSVADVFERADAAMYARKQAMKAAL